MISRRSFLSRILPAAAGVIVAPTLAETLLCSSKKYFFLTDNPLATLPEFVTVREDWVPNGSGYLHTTSINGKIISYETCADLPYASTVEFNGNHFEIFPYAAQVGENGSLVTAMSIPRSELLGTNEYKLECERKKQAFDAFFNRAKYISVNLESSLTRLTS